MWIPECFITTRSQMTVHKAHWGAIKEKRNSYCSLISCKDQEKTNEFNLKKKSIWFICHLICFVRLKDKDIRKHQKRRVSKCVYLFVWAREICTKCVPQASFYTSCVYLSDASFMLWSHKHSQSDIPKGLYCHLQEKHKNTLNLLLPV